MYLQSLHIIVEIPGVMRVNMVFSFFLLTQLIELINPFGSKTS